MNKKLKIVSTLGLAGIMSLSALTNSTLAANITSKAEVQILGSYSSLEGVKNVVPVVLDNTAENNFVTSSQIKERFAGASDFSKTEKLGTGDTFKVGDKKYTVVLFGDVNGDGYSDSTDARMMQEEYLGTSKALKGLKKAAADVASRDGSIDSTDAGRVMNYYFGTKNTVVDKVPDYNEVVSANYTYELTLKDKYVNNQNENAVSFTVKPKEVSAEETKFNVYVNGEKVQVENVDKVVTLASHQTEISDTLDLSGEDDGEIVIELVPTDKQYTENKENVVAGAVVTKKSDVEDTIVGVIASTKRSTTKKGGASFEYYGETKATKLYYVVDGDSEYSGDDERALVKAGKSVDFKDGKADISVSNLEEQKPGYVHYVIEDEYGNLSEVLTATISKVNATELKPVTKMKVPTTEEKTFSWEVPNGEESNELRVVVYKDGKIYDLPEVEAGDTSYTFAPTEAGKYKIEVTVLADDENQADSVVTKSAEVEVKSLEKVSNAKFEIKEDGNYMITWEDSKNKESDLVDYKVEFYKYDGDQDKYVPTTVTDDNNKDNKVEISKDASDFEKNERYIVHIIAEADDDNVLLIDSDEFVSSEFFVINLGLSNVEDKIGENSVTLSVDDNLVIEGATTSYQLEIIEITKVEDPITHSVQEQSKVIEQRTVVLNNNNEIVVSGLKADTQYAFKLYVTIDGVKGETEDYLGADSTQTEDDIKTLLPSVEIKNLTVPEKNNDNKYAEGTIFWDNSSSTLYINGKAYNPSAMEDKYEDDFVKVVDYLSKLNLNTGDQIISATKDELSLKLAESESNGATDSVKIPGTVKTVTIEGTEDKRAVEFGEENVNEVTLKGTDTLYTIKGNAPAKLVVENGIEVTGGVDYNATLNANSTVTLNGKVVTANNTTVLQVSEDENDGTIITIDVDGTSNTNYTFENKDNGDLTVKFASVNNNGTDNQAGSITLVSHGSDTEITVKSGVEVAITGNVDVQVKDGSGSVTLDSKYLTGEMNVNVESKEQTTLNVLSKENSTVKLEGISVDATVEKIREVLNLEDTDEGNSKANVVKAYLDAIAEQCGISGTGALVSVNENSNEVEIVFNKEAE